jgi:hypothetical protein
MKKKMRTATITKVTPKWVRQNGTPVPFDAWGAAGSGVKEMYDTPVGRYKIDAADRVASIEDKKK